MHYKCFSGKHTWTEEVHANCCCNPQFVPVRSVTRLELEESNSIGIRLIAQGAMFAGWQRKTPAE